jgi:hypothetical protein
LLVRAVAGVAASASVICICKGDGQEDGPHEEEEKKLRSLRSTCHGAD